TGWIYPAWVRRFSRAACAIVVVAVAWAVTGVVGAMRLGPHRDLSSLMGAGLALAGAWSVARLMSDGYLRRERALRGVAIGWAVAVWMGV
ncbi:O-antigen ligase domain-containing protein, partial [Pseudomonas sp. FSL R10-2172]|nr:O-antigen ligase domain-containing protein [Pseudomonas sp. FSL R10-2172]